MGELNPCKIESGSYFFCKGCLEHRPIKLQSPDKRYCKCCYDFLLEEAKQLSTGKRPAWIPKPGTTQDATKSKSSQNKPIPHGIDGGIA